MTKPRPIHGKLVIAIGVIHTLFGLLPFVYGPQWLAFAKEGFFNVFPHGVDGGSPFDYPREAAFWFLLAGPTWIALGDLVDHVEKKLGGLPMRFVWTIFLVSLGATWMMPISGFPMLLAATSFCLLRHLRTPAEALARA